MTADRIQVQVVAKGDAFLEAVRYARRHGGIYDPGTRIWTLPAEFEDEAKEHGLRRITSDVANLGEKRTNPSRPTNANSTQSKKPPRTGMRTIRF